MILRDSSCNNMGRGAYDTTGAPKPPPNPPKRKEKVLKSMSGFQALSRQTNSRISYSAG